jgi:hypothetical protein
MMGLTVLFAAAFAFAVVANQLGSPAAMVWACSLALIAATLPLLAALVTHTDTETTEVSTA